MKCPHCGETLPSVVCPDCKKERPAQGNYCCWCGSLKKIEEGKVDFSQRVLCSDGSCIGIINEKGVCGVCGKPYAGELQ